MAKTINWWGETSLAINEAKLWSLGERKIVVQRLEKEWVIWNKEVSQESSSTIGVSSLQSVKAYGDVPYSRHLVNQTSEIFYICAMLADRPIVARPATSLNVMPGEQVSLYVSSPLWFVMRLKPKSQPVVDIPFLRPSDSWFGPSTMQGELCYAKYTDARVNLSQIEKRAHRAITPVLIKNQHTETLVIDRLNLPAPFLALYQDEQQNLWTQETEITYHSDSNQAGLRLKNPPTKSALTLVSEARQQSDSHHFAKSIKNLLG